MDASLLIGVGGAGAVAALVQVIKSLTGLSDEPWSRFAPAVAIVLGVGWNWLVGSILEPPMVQQVIIIQGVLTGLSASGLYSGLKAAAGK